MDTAARPVIGYNIAIRHLVRRINDTNENIGYTDVQAALCRLENDGRPVWMEGRLGEVIRQDAANTVYEQLTALPAPALRTDTVVPVPVWLCEDCGEPVTAADLAPRDTDDPLLCQDCADARLTFAEDDAAYRAYRR